MAMQGPDGGVILCRANGLLGRLALRGGPGSAARRTGSGDSLESVQCMEGSKS